MSDDKVYVYSKQQMREEIDSLNSFEEDGDYTELAEQARINLKSINYFRKLCNKFLARNDRLEAQLAECHRLFLLGGKEFCEVKAEIENVLADYDKLEAMVERLIVAGNKYAFRHCYDVWVEWKTLTTEWKEGQK